MPYPRMVASPGTSSVPPAHRLTVLLADDASSAAEPWHATVRHLLAPMGINLLHASTGRQALQLLESSQVHVAVLDHRLPQLGGLQVIKLAREHLSVRPPSHPTSQVPTTILLTDHLTTPLLHDALNLSVFTVLAKPVNYPQLLDALARAMKRFHNSQWPAPL